MFKAGVPPECLEGVRRSPERVARQPTRLLCHRQHIRRNSGMTVALARSGAALATRSLVIVDRRHIVRSTRLPCMLDLRRATRFGLGLLTLGFLAVASPAHAETD